MKTESSAASVATSAGLKSLVELAEITDTSTQTLNNWFKHKSKLFDAVVRGAAAIKNEGENDR